MQFTSLLMSLLSDSKQHEGRCIVGLFYLVLLCNFSSLKENSQVKQNNKWSLETYHAF